jgi:hypothetical protein
MPHDGSVDDSAVQRLLDAGAAVMVAKLPAAVSLPVKVKRGTYAGFTFGYVRSSLAEQVVMVVRLLKAARKQEGAQSIDLVGAGPSMLLGAGASEVLLTNTIIDLDRFDFDQIKDPSDPRILPGALKYGGVFGFARLCTGGRTLLTNAPRPATVPGVTIQEAPLDLRSTVDLLLK